MGLFESDKTELPLGGLQQWLQLNRAGTHAEIKPRGYDSARENSRLEIRVASMYENFRLKKVLVLSSAFRPRQRA
jgi:hypothetical protein